MKLTILKRRAIRFATLLLLFYSFAVVMMAVFQRDLMYHPASFMESPAFYNLTTTTEIPLRAADGVKLRSWYFPPERGKPLVLFFHGNAGNLSFRIKKMEAIHQRGMGILALSYRGFGGSEGSPSEQGIYADAQAAVDYALNTLHLPASQMILYGESLGTGVAIEMAQRLAAAQQPVSLVVLEAPYTFTLQRGEEMYPWLPVSSLMKDHFDSFSKVRKINAPLLIFHNTGDTVIPIAHGRALYAHALKPKHAFWFDHQGHIAFDWDRLAETMAKDYARYEQNRQRIAEIQETKKMQKERF
jgi:fermentation-respiration switch protein FrsA (DUF1100 family)